MHDPASTREHRCSDDPAESNRKPIGPFMMTTASMQRPLLHAFALLLGACCLVPAYAGLGDAAATVEHDRQMLRGASVKRTSMPSYDRHEMETADGTTVREYSVRNGPVFAVDFAGPALPDLKVLLADHYDDYLAAAKSRRRNHHALTFSSDGVVFTINKLPRGFQGAAHVPSLLPPGVNAGDLR